ncbi:DME family drug/metabolite transporter [Nocardia tenerifensis]|uniref:DME family drug/metabolite transporter n=1 Tax=Nocardia tenerifensis TaxID=228006 RepID=A0A318KEQ6_9NOCA|nr:DMT family transporter [Nocardia tenerifensis]PXX57931.1 DME family drug/metabolite transporter [Nocardia tenerifensis]
MSISVSTTGRSGLVYLVGAGMLWGTGGLLGTLLGRATGLSPIAVAACRLAVGGLLLVALLAASRRPWPRNPLAWRRIGAVAALAATFQACYFGAVSASSVSVATLVTIGASPVAVAVLEQFTGRRAVDRMRAATIGLALSGLALLVGVPTDEVAATGLLVGAALAVGAACAFAAVTVISARPVPGLDSMTTTGLGFTGGAVLLAPLAVLTGVTFEPSLGGFALLAALGLIPTAIAYTLYFRGLPDAGPGTAAILALLEPLTGALLAAIVLGERLTPLGLLGVGLLITALLLTGRRSARTS